MPNRSESVVIKSMHTIVFTACGLTTAFVHNYVNRRPLLSGIQKHIILGIGGAILGWEIYKYRNKLLAERNAILHHYIELHPEDFLEEKEKKYKELFLPWTPVR